MAHSLSPALHRAAYAALGLDWTYSAIDVEPGGAAEFIAGLDESWRGLSVTAPHKDDLVNCGDPDQVVTLTGAANTWVRTETGAIVRNTDVPGYGVALAAHGIKGLRSATVIGNGATARSAVAGLARAGVDEVQVLARRPERAAGLVELATTLGLSSTVTTLGAPSPSTDIVVSTIPAAGLATHADAVAALAPVVFDSVYDPWPTPLAAAAHQRGALVLNGLDLLAGQAVEQIRWMTGGEVTFELLRPAARDAMAARSQL